MRNVTQQYKSKLAPNPLFHYFKSDTSPIDLPSKFTFPFYYDPHPISLQAATELQAIIENIDWKHNFGLDPNKSGDIIGKMFGVLVVQNEFNQLGFLAAFSGKVEDGNQHKQFVPSIFEDLHNENGFYKKGEKELNHINDRIVELEVDPSYLSAKKHLEIQTKLKNQILQAGRDKIKQEKKRRKEIRTIQKDTISESDYNLLLDQLSKESIRQNYEYKDLSRQWNERIEKLQENLEQFEDRIKQLKLERKQKSSKLQKRLFEQYHFINKDGKSKNLKEIFEHLPLKQPPSGSGECAAPKLLTYAFKNNLRPITIAEFWWGQSPKSEIRRHKHFYPACKGKCEPILGHMLEGIEMDPNPLLVNPAEGKTIEVIYEDDDIAIINKPPEFLSVPGKHIEDSVLARLKVRYPEAEGPLLLHRLDMSTSGILLMAKNIRAHKHLQHQFIKRYIKKRYVALLDGNIESDKGTIDLPLRGDYVDRPRQLVSLEGGKKATTEWEVIDRTPSKTKVYFYPITGRTHQLRVHAAHSKGLNSPIVGDDLYGQKADRLYLHAEYIEFTHPSTKEKISFTVKADF